MIRSELMAWVMVPLLLAGGAAGAADDEAARLREQLRSTVLQLRELQDQQATAAAKPATAPPAPGDAALKAKLSAAQAQLRAARRQSGDAAALKVALDKAKADYDALSAKIAGDQTELDKYKVAFGQASDAARTATAERDRLQAALASQTLIATACQVKNARLTSFAEALIEASNRITFGQKIMARDPVLGLTRVRLENLAQEREDVVRGAHCDPRLDAKPPAKSAAAPAPAG